MNEAGADVVVWDDAVLAAALCAIDPAGTAGVALRAPAGPVRERWLGLMQEFLPPSAPVRRVPVQVADGRLLGGLDLAATLRAGRPVAERGLLADADGGVVLLAMAERLSASTAGRIAAVLDAGAVRLERDGFAQRLPARFGVIALDEGIAEDERPPAALLDRLAFHVDLGGLGIRDAVAPALDPDAVAAARAQLDTVHADDAVLEALCGAAMALGIGSIRAPLLALRVARAAAALGGRAAVEEADAALAARLVLAPRATALPEAERPEDDAADAPPAEDEPEPPADADTPSEGEGMDDAERPDRPLEERVLEAAQAAVPPDLLARLRLAGADLARAGAPGRAGARQQAAARGRPAGTRRGALRAGVRLNVIETLRAAAPWQPLRRRADEARAARIEVRADDFRITRFKERTRTATIFAVDASGSAALHRLAEAKGAVELLLAQCYLRRDRVALLAFRGRAAEILLPPTRSLVRAKRSLANLPGGGGTPLAAGIEAAGTLADAVRRRGETPVVVLLTDGRANVALDGGAGRARAEEDALVASRRLRAAGVSALLVDTSPRPDARARGLAGTMGARYLALPYVDASALSEAVRTVATGPAAHPARAA